MSEEQHARPHKYLRILGIDPGGTTGWASLVVTPSGNHAFHHGQFATEDHHLELLNFLANYCMVPTLIVCESFENRGNVAAELISREYIGVVKLYVQSAYVDEERTAIHLHMQSPNKALNFVTDAKLRAIGAFYHNEPHARDAMRHVLTYYISNYQDRPFALEILRTWTGRTS